jgi:hypothetical protein
LSEQVQNNINAIQDAINTSAPLNMRQENFCIEYCLNKGNGGDAAVRAGYSEELDSAYVTASRLLRNPKIIARIAQLREESGVESGVNIEWAVSNLVEVVERSLTREGVRDSDGNIIEWKYDSRGVVSAIKLIGEMKGWLEKKLPVSPDAKAARSVLEVDYTHAFKLGLRGEELYSALEASTPHHSREEIDAYVATLPDNMKP